VKRVKRKVPKVKENLVKKPRKENLVKKAKKTKSSKGKSSNKGKA